MSSFQLPPPDQTKRMQQAGAFVKPPGAAAAQKVANAIHTGPQTLPRAPLKTTARPPAPRLGGQNPARQSTKRPPAPIQHPATVKTTPTRSIVVVQGGAGGSPAHPASTLRALPTPFLAKTSQLNPGSVGFVTQGKALQERINAQAGNLKKEQFSTIVQEFKRKQAENAQILTAAHATSAETKVPVEIAKEPQGPKLQGGENVEALTKVVSERFLEAKAMLLALERGDKTVEIKPGDIRKVTINNCFEAISKLRPETQTTDVAQTVKTEYGILLAAYGELNKASREAKTSETTSSRLESTSGLASIVNNRGLGILENTQKVTGNAEKAKESEKSGPWKAFTNAIRNLFKGHRSA
jgi:hypothetical protein